MTLGPAEKLQLFLNLDALRAEETLYREGASLTPESLKALTLAATGDESQAEAAWLKRVGEALRRGEMDR